MKMLIGDIQHFCLHDGPGIRTTIFLKGCSLRCPWCANPENIYEKPEYYYDKNLCIRNKKKCKLNYGCCVLKEDFSQHSLKESKEKCLIKAINSFGKEFIETEVFNEIICDKKFYYPNGGVTFSGGEPLLHIEKYLNLLKKIKQEKINIIFESSLYVSQKSLQLAMKYANNFIIDFKLSNPDYVKQIIKGNYYLYLNNLDYLMNNTTETIIIRIPIIKHLTNNEKNIFGIIEILKKYKNFKVEIFSGHTLAERKYNYLNKKFLNDIQVEESELNKIKTIFTNNDIKTDIIKI